jgi:hypothetical protein
MLILFQQLSCSLGFAGFFQSVYDIGWLGFVEPAEICLFPETVGLFCEKLLTTWVLAPGRLFRNRLAGPEAKAIPVSSFRAPTVHLGSSIAQDKPSSSSLKPKL